MAFRTRDYGDVLRVFNHSCKFKTVRRILLPLNISWEGITLGTGCHWVLAELHLDTSTTHLYDWFKKTKASTKSWHVWQLATPQSSALLHMFACATLLRTHAVYCLQHPCRPSSSCCTSAVWACVCVFGVCVYVSSVALVEVNEYTAFPRTVNAVAITAFHVVRDARIVGMPAVADKRTAVTVHGKVMKNIGHRLPSANNVVLHPGNNRTSHPCLVLFISCICGICSIPLTATTIHREG